jgi:hypothetical protein
VVEGLLDGVAATLAEEPSDEAVEKLEPPADLLRRAVAPGSRARRGRGDRFLAAPTLRARRRQNA